MKKTKHFIILATDIDTGKRFQCFTWKGAAADGIARAYSDAIHHNRRITDVAAEHVYL